MFSMPGVVSTTKNVAAPAIPYKRSLLQRIFFRVFGQPLLDEHMKYMLARPRRKRLLRIK
jgi:hypothetical protein